MSEQDDADLEAKMEEFLRQQAERESGETFVAAAAADKVLGAAEVPDDVAKEMCRDVVRMLKQLKSNRDMSVNEIKLTIAIEDPRARERRESMGIEESSGVSRDELAVALMDVSEGRIPKDRIALRELALEMAEWPFADISGDSRGPAISAGPAVEELAAPDSLSLRPSASAGMQARRPPKLLGRDKNEASTGLADQLPDWVGYSFLYVISIVPVIIAGTTIAILFFNSLK